MCTLFANLYVFSTWCPHMVYMGCPYIFYIYMIKCGWLGYYTATCLSMVRPFALKGRNQLKASIRYVSSMPCEAISWPREATMSRAENGRVS